MIKDEKSKNNIAWEKIFDKYDILNHIDTNKKYIVTADQIREYREPRLMAKFDHKINLPKIFLENNLSILPVTRGSYIISNFETYKNFESLDKKIYRFKLPDFLQSLNYDSISSETIAINCAFASGILNDFLNEEYILPTVSGRMKSEKFNFFIFNSKYNELNNVEVNNSQIEIDAAYEGFDSLALIEAKRDLSDDFLIRQLYYPYRLWRSKITKNVKPIFLLYSNGVYNLYEYSFSIPDNYNSLKLIKHKNYSILDYSITMSDIENIIQNIKYINEPDIQFPQADIFERVINLCELLLDQKLTRDDVTNKYSFDIRQTNYYTDAARYLSLLDKDKSNGNVTYTLTPLGRRIMQSDLRKRQLELCKLILSHRPFGEVMKLWLHSGIMPDKKDVINIMKNLKLYKVGSNSTYFRRSSTILRWLDWIISLINTE